MHKKSQSCREMGMKRWTACFTLAALLFTQLSASEETPGAKVEATKSQRFFGAGGFNYTYPAPLPFSGSRFNYTRPASPPSYPRPFYGALNYTYAPPAGPRSPFFGGFNYTRPSTPSPFFGGFNYTRPVPSSSKIVVGGSERWHFGYNYTEWAFGTGPFYKNDTLVFMYDPPSNGTFPHSVYLLRDLRSFLTCDLRNAKRVASVTQGGGAGFQFVLRRSRPHYFACGERNGFHCRVGMMKFPVFPLPFTRRHLI